jgi:hypothetical protein
MSEFCVGRNVGRFVGRFSPLESVEHVKKIRLLVAGCWLLVAGCWLLVAGCWLVAGAFFEARGSIFNQIGYAMLLGQLLAFLPRLAGNACDES